MLSVDLKSATTTSGQASFSARGGWWVVAQSVLLAALVTVPSFARQQWRAGWTMAVGAALFAIGASIGIAGARALGRNRTAFPAPLEHSTLVQTGVYRFVRHPLYTSLMLLSFGWGLMWRSIPALVVALLLTALFTAKARREETWLRRKFPEYDDYAKRVRRFIPGIW